MPQFLIPLVVLALIVLNLVLFFAGMSKILNSGQPGINKIILCIVLFIFPFIGFLFVLVYLKIDKRKLNIS